MSADQAVAGRLTTFDIFDTLLTRAVGAPTSVFLLMGRLPEVADITRVTAEEFARLRIEAERRVRRDLVDVTLPEIYRELGVGLALDAEQQATLRATEVALEMRLSRIVPGAHELLARHADGRRVGMSDMYLPVEPVRDLLEQQGLLGELEHVYVSSETKAMKRTGDMFGHVLQREGVARQRWRHIGDDARSDAKVPRLLGLSVHPSTAARLNRYEHIWDSYRWETGGFSSMFAGASRLARLSTAAQPGQRPVVDVAAGVAAPILTSYVLWVLNHAVRDGIDRLYFLARDGEVLFQIARRLVDRLGLAIDVRYLYGSRYVFHRAALVDQDLATADWAWRSLFGLTNEQVVLRLGLDPAATRDVLARNGLQPDQQTPDIAGILQGDGELVAAVQAAALAARDWLQRYLRQEGLLESTPFAIVDTGWEGRLIQSLHDALAPLGGRVDRVFFMGHLDRGKGFERPDAVQGYLFDEPRGTGFLDTTKQVRWLLEVFCAADHGMTIGFTGEGVVRPILAEEHNPTLRSWPWWKLYREVIYSFVDQCVLDEDLAHTSADLRRPVAEVLTTFWEHPTHAEAVSWGGFPFEDDLLANTYHPMATPIRLTDFIRKAHPEYQGKRVWIAASVEQTSAPLRPIARAGLWVAERLRRRGEQAILPRHWRERAALAANSYRVRSASRR